MKIACQTSLAGQGTIAEQFERLQRWGFEGVEITAWQYLDGDRARYALSLEEEVKAAMDATGLPVTTICGGIHFDFLSPDVAKRRADVERLKSMVQLAGRLGAAGIIMVPIFNATPQLPDLWPVKSSLALQQDVLRAILRDVAPVAEAAGACVILEPLNRYESPWLHRLDQAAELCDAMNSPAIGLMADLFHMNIEETDPTGALRKHAKWLRHVHLADNTRLEPGTGCINFTETLVALKDIGYTGAMAIESGLSAAPDIALPKAVHFLQDCRHWCFAT